MNVKGILIFLGGAVCGAASSYLYFRTKVEGIRTEERERLEAEKEQMREYFTEKLKTHERSVAACSKPDISEYGAIASNYTPEPVPSAEKKRKKKNLDWALISETDYAEDMDYEKSTITVYEDGYAQNEDGDWVSMPGGLPENYLDICKENPETEFYVRNFKFREDYFVHYTEECHDPIPDDWS